MLVLCPETETSTKELTLEELELWSLVLDTSINKAYKLDARMENKYK